MRGQIYPSISHCKILGEQQPPERIQAEKPPNIIHAMQCHGLSELPPITDHEIHCYPLHRLLESHPDRPWHHMEFHWSPYVMPESKRIHIRSMNDRCPMQRTQGTEGIVGNDRSRLDVLRKMFPSVVWIAVFFGCYPLFLIYPIASQGLPMTAQCNLIWRDRPNSKSQHMCWYFVHTHKYVYMIWNIFYVCIPIYLYIYMCNWCISAWRWWFTWYIYIYTRI